MDTCPQPHNSLNQTGTQRPPSVVWDRMAESLLLLTSDQSQRSEVLLTLPHSKVELTPLKDWIRSMEWVNHQECTLLGKGLVWLTPIEHLTCQQARQMEVMGLPLSVQNGHYTAYLQPEDVTIQSKFLLPQSKTEGLIERLIVLLHDMIKHCHPEGEIAYLYSNARLLHGVGYKEYWFTVLPVTDYCLECPEG